MATGKMQGIYDNKSFGEILDTKKDMRVVMGHFPSDRGNRSITIRLPNGFLGINTIILGGFMHLQDADKRYEINAIDLLGDGSYNDTYCIAQIDNNTNAINCKVNTAYSDSVEVSIVLFNIKEVEYEIT